MQNSGKGSPEKSSSLTRRKFLELAAAAGFGSFASGPLINWLTPAFGQEGQELPSPLEHYPDRDMSSIGHVEELSQMWRDSIKPLIFPLK